MSINPVSVVFCGHGNTIGNTTGNYTIFPTASFAMAEDWEIQAVSAYHSCCRQSPTINTATELSLRTITSSEGMASPYDDDIKALSYDHDSNMKWLQGCGSFADASNSDSELYDDTIAINHSECNARNSNPEDGHGLVDPYTQDCYHPINGTYTEPTQGSILVNDGGRCRGTIGAHEYTDLQNGYEWQSPHFFRLANHDLRSDATYAGSRMVSVSQPASTPSFRNSNTKTNTAQIRHIDQLFPAEGTSSATQYLTQQGPFQASSCAEEVGRTPYTLPTNTYWMHDTAGTSLNTVSGSNNQQQLFNNTFSLQNNTLVPNVLTHMSDSPLQNTNDLETSSNGLGRDRISGVGGVDRDRSKDDFLLQCKDAGMSYKEIKARGKFEEAESTLRGRYRSLTKPKEARVRKPEWSKHDVEILKQTVARQLRASAISSSANSRPQRHNIQAQHHTLNKIPWKWVAETMSAHGCYRFGNATVKKKYLELMGLAG